MLAGHPFKSHDIGHTVGNYFDWTFFSLGVLRLGMATVGSIMVLGIGYYLSLIDTGQIG